jgi:hypothetical protein
MFAQLIVKLLFITEYSFVQNVDLSVALCIFSMLADISQRCLHVLLISRSCIRRVFSFYLHAFANV